jgi:type IV pilus assembly protein PilM
MPSTKSVWGIDVGQCALKAIRLQWRDGKLKALGFDLIEHAKILSQPDADEQALIRSALGKFMSRNSVKGSTVVISVPGQASFTRFIKLPPVEAKKIPEIVRYEARQQIPFNLEEVVWDYQTISPASAGPREVEVGIFAMKRDIVNDYVSDFLAMHMEPDIVQMAPVALYNFLRYEKKEGGGATLLIDVGAENTNLVIADGDRVWIRNVPIGGNNFTQALVKEFKLPFSKAESLKRHAPESKHARQVFQAMRPVFGDLVTEIQRSIGYYTSLHRDSHVERVVAMGNAFRLAGLSKFIAQSLGVEVSKVEQFTSMPDAEPLSAPLFRENILSFGVAFGLAIQGCGLGSISTSLLPPEILNQKVLRKKRPFFVVAGAAIVAAVGCFAYDQVRSSDELSGRGNEVLQLANEVRTLQDTNKKEQGRFDEQKKLLVEWQGKINDIEGLVGNESYVYDLMRTLWATWPYDERWAKYDPGANTPPRTTLSIIECLNLSVSYVPDVREFADVGAGTSALAEVSVIGPAAAAPAAPAEGQPPPPPPPPPPGGAPGQLGGAPSNAGVAVRIVGITPKTGQDGLDFVQKNLIETLKKDPRTIHLKTPAGEKVLAEIKLTAMFRNNPEYEIYGGRKAAEAGAAAGISPQADKGGDFWFEALWVVRAPEEAKPEKAPAAPAAPAPDAGQPPK